MAAPLITLEGIEGVGKSTHLAGVQQYLQHCGISVATTREPGGPPLSEAVRGLLLSTDYPPMHADTELLLMFAARAEHLRQHIEPLRAQGTWVLCDRFTDSTYAYQGGGRGIPLARIQTLEQWVQGSIRPDLTLWLDAEVNTALQRTQKRAVADRFERETLAFFARVQAAYQQRAHAEPDRIIRIDANRTLAHVQEQIITCLVARFPSLPFRGDQCPL